MTLLLILFILSLVVIGYCLYRINHLVKVIKTDADLFHKQEASRINLIRTNAQLRMQYSSVKVLFETCRTEKSELTNSLETMTSKLEFKRKYQKYLLNKYLTEAQKVADLTHLKKKNSVLVSCIKWHSVSLKERDIQIDKLTNSLETMTDKFEKEHIRCSKLQEELNEAKGQIEELEVDLANTTSMMLDSQKAKETIDLLIKTKQTILVVDDGRDALKEAIKKASTPVITPKDLATFLIIHKEDTPEFKQEPWRRPRKRK